MTIPVLELSDVVVTAARRPILDVPHVAVRAGESVAVAGPNGAGKSTLLHVAALLRQPDRGSVAIHGQTATPRNAAALRRALSVVFQAPLLFDVSVLANAAAGARFHGVPRQEAERRAGIWLTRFGIAHLANQKARTLSGGEAARVALARAFTTDPVLLLADEPFSALDAPTRAQLLPMLRARLQETGAASVLVTHDLDEAFAFAGRLDLIDSGRIIASADPATLIARPPSRRAAELLGIENILPVSIVKHEGDSALVRLQPGGPRVRLRAPSQSPFPAGQEATMTIPAASVHIVPPVQPVPAPENQVPGRVAAVTRHLTGTRLVVETPAPLIAIAPWASSSRQWTTGDPVTVAFSEDSGHLILES